MSRLYHDKRFFERTVSDLSLNRDDVDAVQGV